MPWRALFATLVVVAGSLAPALASACLADQTWLGGYFDGDDDDAILRLVGDDSAAILPPEPPTPEVSAILLASSAIADSADVVFVAFSSPRAPPLV